MENASLVVRLDKFIRFADWEQVRTIAIATGVSFRSDDSCDDGIVVIFAGGVDRRDEHFRTTLW